MVLVVYEVGDVRGEGEGEGWIVADSYYRPSVDIFDLGQSQDNVPGEVGGGGGCRGN